MSVARDQDRLAGARECGEGDLQALGRTADGEAAKVAAPGLRAERPGALHDLGGLGKVVEAFRREDVGFERLLAEEFTHVAAGTLTHVVSGAAEPVTGSRWAMPSASSTGAEF